MKSQSKAFKAIKKAAKAGNKAAGKKHAMLIVETADELLAMFPKGTDRGMLGAKATRAKPEIWKDWDTFKKKAGAMKAAAKKVANGNLAAAGGIGKTCGGCHKLFRGKKAKKKKM